MGMGPGNLWRLSKAESRSISAENFTGEKGKGGMATEGMGAASAEGLGQGWKVSPCVEIEPGASFELADISGPGAIQSMWFGGTAPRDHARETILRVYWDNQAEPSIECPLGDFFAAGWGGFAQLTSQQVTVNPNRGLNCFWEIPFRARCRMTVENRFSEPVSLFYQVNYTLTDVPDDAAYFHAQFRRVNPIPYGEVYTIIDGVQGAGQYVGTYLAVGVTNNRWWGEGEVKFYVDGDSDFPTICNTGTEDYVGGAYDWVVDGEYIPYSTPYMGMHQVIRPDGVYQSQRRFGLYRWHIVDPVRFKNDLRVTIQALGWRSGGRYLPSQCGMASVAFWYQTLPAAAFPTLPDRDYLEII